MHAKSAEKKVTAVGRYLRDNGITIVPEATCSVLLIECPEEESPAKLLELVRQHCGKRIAILSNPNNINPSFRAQLRKEGAHHFYCTGAHQDQWIGLLKLIERWTITETQLDKLRTESQYIGESKTWISFLRNLADVAWFSQCSVLIQGETGTGKEQAARLVHRWDQRAGKRDLVLLDCTTLVPELSGSELYGHEKGSYTNASYTREGAFALANNGTLFLDEIGELPLALQAGLLRAVQEGSYKRIGSNEWRKSSFRLVSATNRDLKAEVIQKRFREDLYYRINTVVLRVPPLRERKDDIIRLSQHFLRKELGLSAAPPYDELLTKHLLKKTYDGNVRELKQLMTAIAARYAGEGWVTVNELPEFEFNEDAVSDAPTPESEFRNFLVNAIAHGENLHQIKNTISDISMKVAIDIANNNLREAAQLLGVDVRTLQLYRQRSKAKSNGHPD